jgi:hypothetical protein
MAVIIIAMELSTEVEHSFCCLHKSMLQMSAIHDTAGLDVKSQEAPQGLLR